MREVVISDKIFELLKRRGMTQKEFSEKTGISQSTISDWKRKKLNPGADKIMVICDALDVSPYELLLGIEGEHCKPLDYITIDKTTEEYELIEQFRSLPRESQQRMLGYAEALKK